MIRDWSTLLSSLRYMQKLPFKIQDIKEIESKIGHPRLLFHHPTYKGPLDSSVITKKLDVTKEKILTEEEFYYPDPAYTGKKCIYTEPVKLKFICFFFQELYQSQGKNTMT